MARYPSQRSIDSLKKKLDATPTARGQVEVVLRYIGYRDNRFDKALLFALSWRWIDMIEGKPTKSPGARKKFFGLFEKAWSKNSSAKDFLKALLALMTDNEDMNCFILAKASVFLMAKQKKPNQPAVPTKRELLTRTDRLLKGQQ